MPGSWKMRLLSLALMGWVSGHRSPLGSTHFASGAAAFLAAFLATFFGAFLATGSTGSAGSAGSVRGGPAGASMAGGLAGLAAFLAGTFFATGAGAGSGA